MGRRKQYCTSLQQWVITSLEDGDEAEVKIVFAYEIDEEDSCQPLMDYLKHRKLPSELRNKTEVQQRASCFLDNGSLYRCSFLGFWLRCLDNEDRKQVMEEAHASVCKVHQSAQRLHDRVKSMGYY